MSLEHMISLARINPENIVNQIGDFVVNHLGMNGLKSAVLGISGGIDSAVVASIVKRAFDKHGGLTLRGYYLPTAVSSSKSERLAYQLAKNLRIPMASYDIQPVIEVLEKVSPSLMDSKRLGNAASAARMIMLSAEAERYNGLILGTGNRDEYFLGYFTKRGDGAADLQPLLSLSKRHVKQVARWLGNIPGEIILRPPTAELELGQTDEKDLGFDYEGEGELIINGFLNGYDALEIHRVTGISLNKIQNAHRQHKISAHKRALASFPILDLDYGNGKPEVDECDKALVIGRFQMIHLGHVDLFYQIKEHPSIKKLLIGIGTRGNTEVPRDMYLFNFKEVRELIIPVLEDVGIPYELREVPDINDNLVYAKHTKQIFPEIDSYTAIVTGEPRTVKCFDTQYRIFNPETRVRIHSSRIRELIRDGKPFAHLIHNTAAMQSINYEKRLREYYHE